MGTTAKRDAKRARIALRRKRALDLRVAGASYEQIAAALKLADKSNARRDILEAIAEITREPAEEVLALELARLDAMFMGLWPEARKGDTHAVRAAIRVMDRRAKYLGLDEPDEVKLSGSVDITADAHAKLLDRLARFASAGSEDEGGTKP